MPSSWSHSRVNMLNYLDFSSHLKRAPAPVRIKLGHMVGRDAVPRWLAVLVAVCLLPGMSTAFGQNPNEQISIYAIDGLALGSHLASNSPAYREYKCSPSDQFDGFTWCQKTRQERERGGFKEHGALKLVECWGDDVPDGKLTSFPMAVASENSVHLTRDQHRIRT
jgi:hypothetical protein